MKLVGNRSVVALRSELRRLRARLPDAEEYVMVHHPALRVGKKPFAILGQDQASGAATLAINLGPDAQASLLGDPRYARTPYIGQHGWVTIRYADLGEQELEALVVASYRRVAGRKRLEALEAVSNRRRMR